MRGSERDCAGPHALTVRRSGRRQTVGATRRAALHHIVTCGHGRVHHHPRMSVWPRARIEDGVTVCVCVW